MAERRYTLVFYLALVVAAAATYGVYRILQSTKASSRIETQPVVVAARDIPEGAMIDRLAVTTAPWPTPTVPAGAFGAVDSVTGRVTRYAVFKGEPIVPGRLAPAGTGPGLEVKITPGKRAMAVRINDVAGISGLLQPNSRVDVLVLIRDATASQERQVAKLFMENMRVLSVGTEYERGEDGKPIAAATATMEVTPEEAERLAIAMNQGSIQLVLRGYGDPDSINTDGATSSDVLGQLRQRQTVAEAPPKPEPRPRPRRVEPAPPPPPPVVFVPPPPKRPDTLTVQVFKAGKREEVKFGKDTARGNTP